MLDHAHHAPHREMGPDPRPSSPMTTASVMQKAERFSPSPGAALHPTVLLGQSSPLLLSSQAPVSAVATSHSALPSTCFSPKQPLSHLPLPRLELRMIAFRPSSPPVHSLSIKSILGCVPLGMLPLRSSAFCSTAWSNNDPNDRTGCHT